MKTNFIDTHRIPVHFLPYLINSDPSGLTDTEINQADTYVNELIQAFEAPLYFDPYDKEGNCEDYFSWSNNVTGYEGSSVTDVKVYFIK
jgi:hypothetical protein